MLLSELFHKSAYALNEAEVPPTRYGYWITSEGVVIAVSYQQHEQVANEKGFRSGYDAMRAGWIRVIAQPRSQSFNVEIEHGCVAMKASIALRRVISAGDYYDYHIDYSETGGAKSFTKPGPLINLVQQSIKRMS